MNGALRRAGVAFVLFALLVALRVENHVPALPNPLTLDLQLEAGEAGRADPLIVAGRTDAGDFLSVRFVDQSTLQFTYDSWGYPGITSKLVAITPGKKQRLEIEIPALHQIQGSLAPANNRVRVVCDGVTVLDVAAHYYIREPARLFFGENPLGGTACSKVLRGQVTDAAGVVIRGEIGDHYSWKEKLSDWFWRLPHEVTVLLLFSVGVGYLSGRTDALVALARSAMRMATRHRSFVGAAALATIGYAWIVTQGTFDFHHGEVFGSFYDYQAASLLHGRLDVPEDAIGGEAFEARGKLYGYFGPTPALLRLPFALSGFAFGKLSRAYMVGYFAAALLASYLILRHAVAIVRTRASQNPDAPPSVFAVFILVGSVGLGSTIFFLGSRGFIFHEALLAGITFALWSCWCALKYLAHPHSRWWIAALICGVLSLHCRPPTGLYSLTFLGSAALISLVCEWRESRTSRLMRRHVIIGSLCVIGVTSLNAVAWLKFRTFDAAPLRLSRPYTGEPGRLERIDGKSFHLANLPFNFDTYVLRPNFRLERGFPWIYLGSKEPRRDFPKAKIDLPDFTLAIPYAMPSLFALATLGCFGAMLAYPITRVPIIATWLAAQPMTLALFAAVATAQRYTGDFCPLLICAACIGLAAMEPVTAPWFAGIRLLITVATVSAIAVTFALTLHYQGETLWGVPESTRRNYQELRQRIDRLLSQRTTHHFLHDFSRPSVEIQRAA